LDQQPLLTGSVRPEMQRFLAVTVIAVAAKTGSVDVSLADPRWLDVSAVDAEAQHRAKGFNGHQDAMAADILDFDTAVHDGVTLFGGKSRIHCRIAVQKGHTTQGTTTAAPDKSRMKSKDTPWKGTTP
jgi:hypothetical protein